MPRLTVTISEEHEQILAEKAAAAGSFRSKDEFVREAIEAHQRVEDLSNQLACLEAEVESLRSQREQLKQKAARVEELEDKLWDLQFEYQQLIHEEAADADVDDLVAAAEAVPADERTALEDSELGGESTAVSATAGDSESDTVSESTPVSEPKTSSESTADSDTDVLVGPSAGDDSAVTTETRPVAAAKEDVGATEGVDTGDDDNPPVAVSAAADNPLNGEMESDEAGQSSVYIDRELAVKRQSVGKRLKSAILGGTLGKR